MAHQIVDGLAGVSPAVYFHLNQVGDLQGLATQIEWWLDASGVLID